MKPDKKPDNNHDNEKPRLLQRFLVHVNPENAPVSAAKTPYQKTDTSTGETVDRTSTLEKPGLLPELLPESDKKPDNNHDNKKPRLLQRFLVRVNPDNAPVSETDTSTRETVDRTSTFEKPGLLPELLPGLPPRTRASVYHPPPETRAQVLLPKQTTLLTPLTPAERAKFGSRSAPPRPASGGPLPTGRKHSSSHVRAEMWEQLGLFPRECGGRGDCMYYALVFQLVQLGLVPQNFSVQELRLQAADCLEKNVEYMQSFNECKEGADMSLAWQQFCNSVRTMGEWGDEQTLVAVSKLYKVDIQVWSMTEQRLDRFIHYIEGQKTASVINIGHHFDVHYVAMTPPE
jgi:hypothetical protein